MVDYPVMLNLKGRSVVIIGGGMVAWRKTVDLLKAEAEIMVISPTTHPRFVDLANRIELRSETYTPGLLTNMVLWDMEPFLVFAATDSREVNQQIADEAHALGILVNVVDDSSAGDFTSMATVKRDSITIAISTGGASPALSAHLREKLEAAVGDEYATLAHWLGDLRPLVRDQVEPETRRRDLWQAIIASPALDHLRSGDQAGARAIIDALVQQAIDNS